MNCCTRFMNTLRWSRQASRLGCMTGPAATPAGEVAAQGKELYQSGPWLVTFGHGTRAEARALQVEDQCHARDVHPVLVPVDEVAGDDLSYYTALIAFLPSTPSEGRPAPSTGKIVEIIKTYRARRPDGLTSLLDGSRRWFQAGVVQVFGTYDAHQHLGLESIIDRICLVHRVDDDEPIDPFAVYQAHGRPALLRPGSSDHLTLSTRSLGAYLLLWGFSAPEDVSRGRELIDRCRVRYEDPRFRVLHRPIQGRDLNRLDFLLDEPETRAPGRKKWMENGARVARDVFDELERQFPDFHRPNGRDNTKNAQKDLRMLYRALRAVEAVSKVLDQEPPRS